MRDQLVFGVELEGLGKATLMLHLLVNPSLGKRMGIVLLDVIVKARAKDRTPAPTPGKEENPLGFYRTLSLRESGLVRRRDTHEIAHHLPKNEHSDMAKGIELCHQRFWQLGKPLLVGGLHPTPQGTFRIKSHLAPYREGLHPVKRL